MNDVAAVAVAVVELDMIVAQVIVDSLSESRLKSVRFLVGESSARVTSSELTKIIKINH
jgi:hypothetical protein